MVDVPPVERPHCCDVDGWLVERGGFLWVVMNSSFEMNTVLDLRFARHAPSAALLLPPQPQLGARPASALALKSWPFPGTLEEWWVQCGTLQGPAPRVELAVAAR
jgi:hypothetical protein